jgi:hypothetical protein
MEGDKMLITKTEEKIWTARNMRKYIDLGYTFTKLGDIFLVNIDDFTNKSRVEVFCDYCLDNGIKTIVSKSYENYKRERRFVEKDTCDHCKQLKYKDYILIKQNNGTLKYGEKGYFNFKENRLKELKYFIEKYKTLDKMEDHEEGRKLYQSIINNKEKPFELALELGYTLDDVMENKPEGYYNDFEVLKTDILLLSNKLGRFPNQEEILSNLKIGYRYLKKHGGMYEIKRKLNISDERNKFIDNSGFYNNSSYEMIVANFLLENHIPYLREQHIVENYNYRSDFTIFIENSDLIHVEVWGYLKSNNKIAKEYNEVRTTKEQLYNDYKIKYLSVEPTIFYKKNYKNMQQSLLELFNSILNNKHLKFVNQEVFIPSYEYSDEEILKIAMAYSKDENFLPEANVLKENHIGLYNQILKRYQNYSNFAERFNKRLVYKSNKYWTDSRIYEYFDYMIEKFGKILSHRESLKESKNDLKINDYSKVCSQFNQGIINLKLKYYLAKVGKENFVIPDNDLKWIVRADVNKSRRGNIPYTLEQQEQAKRILEKYNSKSS